MAHEHTVRALDQQLALLESRIAEMGGLCESQIAGAIDALARRDADLAAEVISRDPKLDALENEVNDITLRLLALRQPVAEDLRAVLVGLKVSADLERIGDLATNIAKRAIALAQVPPVASTITIVRMSVMVQRMVKSALDSYVARDAHQAMDILKRDEEVDQIHTSLFREVLTYMMENPRNITPCAHLLFIAKNIERIGDHVTNIAERVFFLVRGGPPELERRNEDESSSTVVRSDAFE